MTSLPIEKPDPLNEPLSDKQERYVQEYLIDLHQRNAALRAGYSPKSVDAQASQLMKLPKVLSRIAKVKAERALVVKVTQQDVLKQLVAFTNADVTEVIGLTPEEIKKLPDDIRMMISSFKHTKRTIREASAETGMPGILEETIEIKFYDKMKAIDMINKHIGFYEEDNSQQSQVHVIEPSDS